jgi:hypothetical protein
MIVTISQPRYLPWLGYFHRIAVSDLLIYLDTVQYTPRDWENRNKVKTDRGWAWLTVPVNARYKALISEVRIDNEQNWQKKHLQTIKTYYSSAPYFSAYSQAILAVYEDKVWENLIDLNLYLTQVLFNCLNLEPTQFIQASTLNVQGKGSDLILNLCKEVRANVYLSGSHGKSYLDENKFVEAGVEIVYQDYHHPIYPQLYSDFQPYMAIIDLIFNCGLDSSEILMKGQEQQRK